MSRRHASGVRKILPDPKYKSEKLSKFINIVMKCGKKSIAEKIVYFALEKASEKRSETPMETFNLALENVKPYLEVKARRVGGSTYQIPIEVRAARRDTLAMRWLIEAAKKRKENTMSVKLFSEICDAIEKRGGAYKKKEDTHKMAEANKAFSHFKW